jgi:hypothetical protein
VPSILKDEVLFLPAEDVNFPNLDGTEHHAATVRCPSNSGSEVFVKGMHPMRVCILWPALQEPPAWLTEEYELVKGAEVQVSDAQQEKVQAACFAQQCSVGAVLQAAVLARHWHHGAEPTGTLLSTPVACDVLCCGSRRSSFLVYKAFLSMYQHPLALLWLA